MQIAFNGRLFKVPAPIPRADEIVIYVSRYYRFQLPDDPKTQMFRFSNPLVKLIYFMWHEGIQLTYYKTRSAMLQQALISERALVLSFGRIVGSERWAVGLGPVDWPESECHVFPSVCVKEVPADCDLMRQVKLLIRFFDRQPKVQLALYYYSAHAGGTVPIELSLLLSNSNKESSIVSESASSKMMLKQPLADVTVSKPSVWRNWQSVGGPVREHELFMAGAGVYAYSFILPALKGFKYHSIIDLNPALAAVVGNKFGFRFCDTNCDRALKRLANVKQPVLIVATYHSSHLEIAETAIAFNPGTKIIIEKPPVADLDQLDRLLLLRRRCCFIDIGYNRRFAPFTTKAKKILSKHEGPTIVTCIVKEKTIPDSHWYYWPTQGTRITGNISHWIDLGHTFIDNDPVSITSHGGNGKSPADEPTIIIKYKDGSRLTIVATDAGNTLRGIQEFIDIRKGDITIQIDDFQRMKIQVGSACRWYRTRIRDKGHFRMYRAFRKNILNDCRPIYSLKDLDVTTRLYLQSKDALMKRNPEVKFDPGKSIFYD